VTLAATALYTELMTSVIARRRTPLTDMIVDAATAGEPSPFTDDILEKAQALRDLNLEQVAIRSSDGYVLRARWYPVEGARRTLILVHGWRSCWNLDFSASAPFFHDNACNLLLIDQRCHGESGGDLISYGIRERHDVLEWLDWLEANHPGFPIYLCGVSMGAATVLMTAELPVAERVTGILADCAYSTPDEMVKLAIQKSLGGMTAPTLAAVNLNCKRRGGFTLKSASPIEAMAKNTEIPCFFVHGGDDDLVPVRMSIENYYACRAPKELYIIPGAGHGLSYVVDTEGYQSKVLAFFEAWDHRLPPPEAPKTKKRIGSKAKRAATVEKA
jgi:pimeloyl-ACP methyl ester carboxylesterase